VFARSVPSFRFVCLQNRVRSVGCDVHTCVFWVCWQSTTVTPALALPCMANKTTKKTLIVSSTKKTLNISSIRCGQTLKRAHTHMHTHAHLHTHTCTRTCTRTHAHTYAHAQAHAHAHARAHTLEDNVSVEGKIKLTPHHGGEKESKLMPHRDVTAAVLGRFEFEPLCETLRFFCHCVRDVFVERCSCARSVTFLSLFSCSLTSSARARDCI